MSNLRMGRLLALIETDTVCVRKGPDGRFAVRLGRRAEIVRNSLGEAVDAVICMAKTHALEVMREKGKELADAQRELERLERLDCQADAQRELERLERLDCQEVDESPS